jgi:undecaprenyl-diphosphatase
MYQIDTQVTALLNGLAGRSHALDVLMVATTQFGVPLMVLAVAAQWWPRRGRESERHVILTCGLAFLVGLALNQAVLLFVHRIRPYDAGVTNLLVAPSRDPSFPSDHATAAFSIVFGYLLHGRVAKAAAFFLAALLVVFSRVYIGAHYAGDILGGAYTALIAACFVRLVYRRGTPLDRWVTTLL